MVTETKFNSKKNTRRVLYICHDGDLFGSQHSLAQIIEQLPADYEPFVSLARSGPLEERLKGKATLLRHERAQWMKHDHRSVVRWLGDLLSLGVSVVPRVRHLVQLIKENRIDVVHTNSVVSLEGALAAKVAEVPHVWHIRELFALPNPKLNPLLGRGLTARVIASLSSKVVCISKAVQQPFIKKYSDKTTVIYNAVPVVNKLQVNKLQSTVLTGATDYPLLDKGPKALGYVGRLSPNKRIMDVIEALVILREKGEAVPTLHVFGKFVDRVFERQIMAAIQQHHLESTVVWHGFETDVDQIYNTFDVFILPSLHEPFGRVLIEAMAAGKLCLGAKSGGIPEIIEPERTGFLYPPCDTQALATLIERVTHLDEKTVDTLLKYAKEDVMARFSMPTQMKALCAVYDEVVT